MNREELLALADVIDKRMIEFAQHFASSDGFQWITNAAHCATVSAALRAHATNQEKGR
jgi:hypothetical protein